jgi:hypothetical protein
MKNKILLLIVIFLFVNFVNAQNEPPIANNDTVSALYNTKISINVRANDDDPDGGIIRVDTVLYNGDALVDYTSSKVIYTGAIGFFGPDSLQYVIRDTDDPIGYDTAWVFVYVFRKSYENLNINNINAYIGKDANLLNNRIDGMPGFEVPAGSGNNTIYAFVPWFGGEVNGVVKMNALRFGQAIPDFALAGPIMDEEFYVEYDEEWDRVWKINRYEIYYHQGHWNEENYEPIEVIANWPAHGDTVKGQAFYIAPFVDYNDDGVYNPLDGDYPEIVGDQAIFLVYNLIRPFVLLSQNDPVNLEELLADVSNTEVHGLFYGFECEEDSALQFTVYVNIKFINRADETYTDAYLGLWSDTDIGAVTDDYIGADVMRNSFFGYNGNNFDPGDGFGPGYGEHPPAQSTTLLKGVKMDDDGVDNAIGVGENESVNGLNFGDGIVDNEYWGMNYSIFHDNNVGPTGDPILPQDYYNSLQSIWKDGTPLSYGGIGYDPENPEALPTRFMYPGISDPFYYGTGGIEVPDWNEGLEGNIPFDRRGMASTGPFTLLPFDTVEVDAAFVFGRDFNEAGSIVAIPIMKERIDSIRSYYLAGQTPCSAFAVSVDEVEKEIEKSSFSVYPNPFSETITFDNSSSQNMEIVIYNLLGKELLRQIVPTGKTLLDLSQIKDNALIIKAFTGDRIETKKLLRVR